MFTVGGFTALSRVMGLGREMLQSRLIGAGVEQSAFTLAFAIPNMSRKLFGEGALTAAFVPVFKAELEKTSVERAAKLARAVLTMMALMLGSAVALAWIGLDVSVRLCGALSPRATLTFALVKTLLPYMFFICGAAFGMGVLNAMDRFKASSLMPCLLNVFWIGALGVCLFFPEWSVETRVRAIAFAILAAGFAQMAFMFHRMAKAGVRPGLSFVGWKEPNVRLVWRNMAIGALGAGAVQINYMLDQALGQLAAPWAAGVIGYAERLMDLPLGVVGAAFATVLLPAYAGHFARNDVPAAREAFVSATRNMLFVMIPSAAGLFVLAGETTAAVYAGGAFGAEATLRVSRALAVYAVGLGFFGLQRTLVPWFHAQADMKTPLKLTVWTVCLNAVLNILAVALLPVEWRHVGLASSTSVCAAAHCLLLVVFARRKNGSMGFAALAKPVAKMLAASVALACTVLALRPFTAPLGRYFGLGTLIVAGGAAYLAVTYALGLRFSRPRRR